MALLHREELTQDEVAVIQGVLDIDVITSEYDAELADPVKETFRDDAEPGAMSAYLGLWLEQLARYPVEYIDAAVNLSGELYDPLMQKTEFYEKSSFHNLDGDEVALWHKESPFYMLNETLMELHYMLASLLSINLGQCAFLSLMAGYLLARSRKLLHPGGCGSAGISHHGRGAAVADNGNALRAACLPWRAHAAGVACAAKTQRRSSRKNALSHRQMTAVRLQ